MTWKRFFYATSSLALLMAATAAFAQDGQNAGTQSAATGGNDQTVVVKGLRKSLYSAQRVKQNSDKVEDVVVAEDIGKLPDNNASEALARVTGIQVNRYADEANGVLVRGLPNVETTLNGREIFTADGRSVALQDFPADSLASLEVYKSTTADTLDGGIAGLINVRLRRPFDFTGTTIAGGIRAVSSNQTGRTDPIGNVLFSTRWQTGVGEMGVLLNASVTSAHYLNSVRYDGYVQTPTPAQVITPASAGNTFTFPQDIGIFYARGFRYRPSVNGSYQWKVNDRLDLYADALWQAYRGRSEDDFLGIPIRGCDPALNDVVVKNGVAQSLSATLKCTTGPSKNTNDTDTDTYQYAIGGKWRGDKLTATTDLAFTDSTVTSTTYNFDTSFKTLPTVVAKFDVGYGVDFTLPGVAQYDPNTYIFRGLYDARGTTKGKSIQWRTDFVYRTGWAHLTDFDFGFRYSDRDASSIFGDRYAYLVDQAIPLIDVPGIASQGEVIPAGFRGSGVQSFRDWFTASRAGIRDNMDALRDFVRTHGATNYASALPDYNPVNDYAANEKTTTGYVQAKYALTLGVPVDGTIGVRVVKTENTLTGTNLVTVGSASTYETNTAKSSYTDTLPNISARFRFSDAFQLRLTANKTLTRPGYNQINPALIINQTTEGAQITYTGSTGNPNLEPVRSTNYDASLEYYWTRTSSASLAVFKRDISGFISTYRVPVNDPVYGQIDVYRPENAGTGEIKGVEAAYTTFFDFLPGLWSGFGTQLNYTLIDGKQSLPASLGAAGAEGDIPGVSKTSYNIVGLYEKGPISARLAYNYRSHFVTNYTAGGVAAAEYTKAVERLDFSASYELDSHLTFTLDATNLTGKPFEDYFGDVSHPRDVRYEGKTISAGLRFRY